MRYYFWNENTNEFIFTHFNGKLVNHMIFKKSKEFIDAFINSEEVKYPLYIIKKFMKTNATDIEETKHIYLSLIKPNEKINLVYIGESGNTTRDRWVTGSGSHLNNVFNYIYYGGKNNLPNQLTDLMTLYFGGEHQIIFTLETGIISKKILTKIEMAYQYFFDMNSVEFCISMFLHKDLKKRSREELKKLKEVNEKLLCLEKQKDKL